MREFLRNWSPNVAEAAGARQSAALPYCVVDGRATFLLITSRRTGRWIFPKGAVGSGLTPWESAAREAMEEGGVTGEISNTPIGSYRASSSGSELIDVDLFPLRVLTQLDEWQEMDQRLRHWTLLPEARRLLADPALSRHVELLSSRLSARGATR
ncbi:hypothetical protein VW29_08675 [Devosia limi DSM 17137]|nr:hypothetical protein VW29_08675 [Devosia limi DSM 17137]